MRLGAVEVVDGGKQRANDLGDDRVAVGGAVALDALAEVDQLRLRASEIVAHVREQVALAGLDEATISSGVSDSTSASSASIRSSAPTSRLPCRRLRRSGRRSVRVRRPRPGSCVRGCRRVACGHRLLLRVGGWLVLDDLGVDDVFVGRRGSVSVGSPDSSAAPAFCVGGVDRLAELALGEYELVERGLHRLLVVALRARSSAHRHRPAPRS